MLVKSTGILKNEVTDVLENLDPPDNTTADKDAALQAWDDFMTKFASLGNPPRIDKRMAPGRKTQDEMMDACATMFRYRRMVEPPLTPYASSLAVSIDSSNCE